MHNTDELSLYLFIYLFAYFLIFSESVSFYPVGVPLLSGDNVLIGGLCYHPGSDVLCDFGEAGTVKGHKFNDARAVCSVPFMAKKTEAEVSVYPSDVSKLNFAKTFVIGEYFGTKFRLLT